MSKKLARRLLSFLPKTFRHQLIRAKYRFPTEFPPELEIKIADCQQELEAAFRILHDSYVESNLMDPLDQGVRLTKYHALPTTTTVVAKWAGEVVGTLSFIQDSALGLPMDSGFDISEVRNRGGNIGEFSSGAIKKKFRGNGLVFASLFRYLFEYARDYLHIERAVGACVPGCADLYVGVLGVEPLKHPLVAYGFVKGTIGQGFSWDLKNVVNTFGIKSKRMPRGKSFYKFYSEALPSNFVFPKREYYKAQDPVLTPQMLEYFFVTKTNTYSTLKDQEQKIINSKYPTEFRRRLPGPRMTWKAEDRLRFNVLCKATTGWASEETSIEVTNVSHQGLCVRTHNNMESIVTLNIQIGSGKAVKLKAQTRWSDGQGHIGLKILEAQPQWKEYIGYLESDFTRERSQALFAAAG